MHPSHFLGQFILSRALDGVLAGFVVMLFFLRLDDSSLVQLLKHSADGVVLLAVLTLMLCSLFATAIVGLALCFGEVPRQAEAQAEEA